MVRTERIMPEAVMTWLISNRRGFSFIELLVVLSIIVVLSGLGFYGIVGMTEGTALSSARDEAGMIAEMARSMAIYSGQGRRLRFDAGTQTMWVDNAAGVIQKDTTRLERGITITGPGTVPFTATGALQGGADVTYTFTAPRSGKTRTLTLHARSGRVERN